MKIEIDQSGKIKN